VQRPVASYGHMSAAQSMECGWIVKLGRPRLESPRLLTHRSGLVRAGKDPMTNEALPSKALVPVLALRQLIAQWQEQQQRLRLRQQPAAAAADSTGHHAADQCGVTTDARDSRPLGDHTNFSR
jgi:hypothetical protein